MIAYRYYYVQGVCLECTVTQSRVSTTSDNPFVSFTFDLLDILWRLNRAVAWLADLWPICPPQWQVQAGDQEVRLDKFLASSDDSGRVSE